MAIQKKSTFSLKDHLFNKERVKVLAAQIKAVYPQFEEKKFIQKTARGFAGRELKERMSYLTKMLTEFLPSKYEQALTIIIKSLPKKIPDRENFINSG